MLRSLCLAAVLLFVFAHKANAQCTASITQTQMAVCQGQSTVLSATPGGTFYQWYENGIPIGTNSDNITITGTVPGTIAYTVDITFNTCTASASAALTVFSVPMVTASNNNPFEGGTMLLTVTGGMLGSTYSWTGPNGFSSTLQNPSTGITVCPMSGIYTVAVTIGNCTSFDTTLVTVQSLSTIIASNNSPVCLGDTLHLTATPVIGSTYSWTGPGGFTCSQQDTSLIIDNTILPGIYTITANNNGCYSTDTTLVAICNTMFVNFYNDQDNNCAFDSGIDNYLYQPILTEIDSNGVPIDTISSTAGFYYAPFGTIGDTYTFKILSLPGDQVPFCPSTGMADVILLQSLSFTTLPMGVVCSTYNSFDLGVYGSNPGTVATAQSGYIQLTNPHCNGVPATVTLQHSDEYEYSWGWPWPTSVSGNTVIWDYNNISTVNNGPVNIYYYLSNVNGPLVAGDTTHSIVSITPTTGDVNTTNNTWTKVDTVVASLDPNAITAYPEGCVAAGTKMQYTIQFENVGNAPAENIYVLDTLPAELDANTMELVMSSHTMYVTKMNDGTNTIFRFDFPNINLPDSSDHAGCHGMFVYTVNASSALPYGDSIDHRAGIYFDYNAVVMTNTARTTICVPANIHVVSGSGDITLYPNPAGDELTLISNNTISNYTITNSIGQVMMEQKLNDKQTRLDIHSLAPGMYYITVKGEGTSETLKFVKK